MISTNATPRLAGKNKEELAAIAYRSVEGIEFLEMNDGHRLGYHVYRFVNGEIPSLATAIYEAKARTPVAADELERVIGARLGAEGVSLA
jgi:hypothetical protein